MGSTKRMPANNIELESLLDKIKNKDLEALENLYALVRIPIYNFALSIVKNTHMAEDVLHDVIIKVYNNVDSYKTKTKPMSWILTITKNEALMKLRKESRNSFYSEDILDTIGQEETLRIEDKILLTSVFEVLDDKERNIITLHVLSGLKHKEIASILKLPLSTVLSKYSRGLKKLKKIIEEGD